MGGEGMGFYRIYSIDAHIADTPAPLPRKFRHETPCLEGWRSSWGHRGGRSVGGPAHFSWVLSVPAKNSEHKILLTKGTRIFLESRGHRP